MTEMLSKKKLIKLLKRDDTRLVAAKSSLTEDYSSSSSMAAFGLAMGSEVQIKVTLIVPQNEGDDE